MAGELFEGERRSPQSLRGRWRSDFTVNVNAQQQDHQYFDHDHDFHGFVPGSIVLSGTVYVGNADTVIPAKYCRPAA